MAKFNSHTLDEIFEELAFRCTYSDYKNYKKGDIVTVPTIDDLAKSGKTWISDTNVDNDKHHISIVRTGIKEDEGKIVLIEFDILYKGLLDEIDSELETSLGLGLFE